MTEEKTTLEMAHTAGQAAGAVTPVDGSSEDSRPGLSLGSSPPEQPEAFSRISFSPELRKAISYAKLSRRGAEELQATLQPEQARRALLAATVRNAEKAPVGSGAGATANQVAPNPAPETEPVPTIAAPRARAGVIIACLLGTVPIIALAFVRGQGDGAEIPQAPTTVTDTLTAPAAVIDSAARSAGSPELATRESEADDASLGSRLASAAVVPVPQMKGRSSSTSSAPGAPVVSGRPSAASRRTPGPNTPCPAAPVQAPWFDYR